MLSRLIRHIVCTLLRKKSVHLNFLIVIENMIASNLPGSVFMGDLNLYLPDPNTVYTLFLNL